MTRAVNTHSGEPAPWRAVWLMLALLTTASVVVTGAEKVRRTSELRVGFPATSFSTVNTTDARASIKLWIETMGRNHGYELEVDTRIFNSAESLYEEVAEDRLDLVIMNAWDYLDVREEQLLRPVFIPSGQEEVLDNYLLLVRRDGNIGSLAELRGADIALLDATGIHYARQWLDTQVLDQGLGDTEEFFGTVSVVDKVSAAVLPVFFGKFDACLVDCSGYRTMQQMNPQVERQLLALLTSPPLIETIICMHVHGHEFEEDIVQTLGELHLEPRGQQILMVFKMERLVQFDPVYMESLISFREQHLELTGQVEDTLAASRTERSADE